MKLAALTSMLLLGSPVLAGVSISPARPDQLNSKHQLLRVQQAQSGQVSEAPDDSASRLAVGANVTLVVPAQLGLGHGPFFDIYPEPATIQVVAPADGGLVVSGTHDDKIDVRCTRAGVFELSIDVRSGGLVHVTDTAEIGCIAPTRFTVTNAQAVPAPYLAGASEITVLYDWYGKRADGREVHLAGTLPVAVAPGQTAIAPQVMLDGSGGFVALHGASSVSWVSAGLTATLPVEIVDAKAWKLDLVFQDTREVWQGTHVAIARARAVDAHGRMLSGLRACSLTTYHGDVASKPVTSCMARVVRDAAVRRELPSHRWTPDRVCFAVLDQQVCDVVAP